MSSVRILTEFGMPVGNDEDDEGTLVSATKEAVLVSNEQGPRGPIGPQGPQGEKGVTTAAYWIKNEW